MCILSERPLLRHTCAVAVVEACEGDLRVLVSDEVSIGTKENCARDHNGKEKESNDWVGLLFAGVMCNLGCSFEGLANFEAVVFLDVVVDVLTATAKVRFIVHVAAHAVGGGAVYACFLDCGKG